MMKKSDFINMIYEVENDLLDDYAMDYISESKIIGSFGEMCGVHLMASVLLDELKKEEQDNENA